jgi:hypothetical protein
MGFVPIQLNEYVRKHLKANPGEKKGEFTRQLKDALARYQAGATCDCGEPIWVIGSSVLGDTCFTCATLEAEPSGDYEIAEACHKMARILPEPCSRKCEAPLDSDTDDRDVPF